MKKGIYLNDTIHGLIPLSEYEKRIISSIGFNRLHDVYQNSTVYLTFPTNRTKRFEHSIGTMKLCSDMFYYSVLNSSETTLNTLYEIFEQELVSIISKIAKNSQFCEQMLGGMTPSNIPPIELDKFRYSLIPNNVPAEYQVIHLILIQSIRAAALLHDIGHPPFSHIVEFALKAVYEENKNQNPSQNNSLNEFTKVMSKYFEDNKKLHEQMGDEISDSILRGIICPISDEDERYNENLFEVLILESVKRIFSECGNFKYLHRIIDSSLDGDRLDYVTRDSINSGMNSGTIDYKRIINDMQIIIDESKIYFCFPLKAVNSIEDFIKRRYNIYKDIIYHHRVIKTYYLLEYTVRDLVKKYLKEIPTDTTTSNKMVIPFDISGLWFPLGEATSTEKSNALSQWNDSWLMTILKQIFYTDYYRNTKIKSNDSEYILSQRLSELLRNTKCYYSLIKRSENFKIIDDSVKEILSDNRESIEQLVAKINKMSNKKTTKTPPGGATLDIKATLDFIEQILGNAPGIPKGFILAYISKHYKAIQLDSFENFIKEIVEEETEKIFTNVKVYDRITVFKNISIGLDNPIYFYDYHENIFTLNDISGISDILRLDSDYLPVFYIYILMKDGDSIIKEKRELLLESIGKKIGSNIVNKINNILQNQIMQMEDLVCAK